ncbi:uncharacterized protein BXZ73DRAFT_99875 [Epithele typhae]|uniref:uncharacterized protein n=1 Tax=Epithele typhae TaxID=378194 RepID=UPI0020087933|nr:uncharacterized protein BXZ73DRAFT_99875 [Epithele typhae]KAH9938814.1 hypothetical protein BXZ73DRAFT_99875 [Epithele typhae]
MATWVDYAALVLTLAFFAGMGYMYLYMRNFWSGAVENTKGSLQDKGFSLSKSGVSVKTDKRFDHEQYLDATQRGFIKAFNASSAGKVDPDAGAKKSKRGLFGRRAQVEKT